MKRVFIALVGICLFFVLSVGLGFAYFVRSPSEQKIVVYAGAAAAPVYQEAASLFERKYNVKVELRLGGSGQLLSAMSVAKAGDIFIPGSPEYILKAVKLGVVNVSTGHIVKLAYLVPAIIVQKGNPKNITCLEDLARPGLRVGIADPESVCVGLYAKELLEKNGLWDSVKKNIVVYTHSCEATANLIYMGAVDAIIGWHVFYYWNPEKSDIVWIEPSRIPKISYIAGALTVFTQNRDLAIKFLDFLTSPEMSKIWAKYGYFPTLDDAKRYAPNAEVEEVVGK